MGLFPEQSSSAGQQQGLICVKSSFPVQETVDRLVHAVEAKGLTVFCRIDHAAGAVEAGLKLRPTQLLMFGNAKGGTPLMQANQAIGIDLPLKALAWEDAAGQTWLVYNDPVWLTVRHGIETPGAGPATAMRTLLAVVTQGAAMP
jgi:uncharacterized protein (DUF302 family)